MRRALVAVGALALAAMLAGCGGLPKDQPAIGPPNPPPGLTWYPVGTTTGGGAPIETACTPWGDRLYAMRAQNGAYAGFAVIPAANIPCGSNLDRPTGPGSR